MGLRYICILMICLAACFACCSSDPEGPVAVTFLEGGTYGIEAGETHRFVTALSGTTVTVPTGIGESSLLRIGELKGVRFDAILIKFDFTANGDISGKTVSGAIMDLPVRIADTLLEVTCHELLQEFDEEDTLTVIPPFDPSAITDSIGNTERLLGLEINDFSIDGTLVSDWLKGEREHYGIAILWEEEHDPTGLVEMHAHELGTDPAVIRVEFTDGTSDTFPSIKDYSIAGFEGDGLNCIGGVASRIFFDFDLAGLDERAMVHASFIQLAVNGDEGFGVTPGDTTLLSLPVDFYYYLYTPNSSDPLNPEFLEGTGVDNGSFNPALTQTLKLPLRGFIPDVVSGLRDNTGLVLQSDLETVRIQRFLIYGSDADSLLRPYLEVIYSLPAEFPGEP